VTRGITGLNHITLAVVDLDRSLAFYRDVLGCKVRAFWSNGAYLEAGSVWLCLALADETQTPTRSDYSHIAFSIPDEDFTSMRDRLNDECKIWKDNVSEGDSIYFLDPDGHKLEIHCGSLESRLSHYRENPNKGVAVFD